MSEQKRGLGRARIGGQDRPFQVYSIRQTSAFCEQKGIELDEYWQTMARFTGNGQLGDQLLTITFVYSALYAGARKERIPVDFTHEDVIDWFEEADAAQAAEFLKPLELWSQLLSQSVQHAQAAESKAAPKKKR